MPDVNLLEDDDVQETKAPSHRSAGGKSSVGSLGIILVVLVVVVVGGYFLYQSTFVQGLLGKKSPAVVQVQTQGEDQFQMDQNMAIEEPVDTVQDLYQMDFPEMEEGQTAKLSESAVTTESGAESLDRAPVEGAEKVRGMFAVQVFSFLVKKNADAIAVRLNEAGYEAYIVPLKIKDTTWYAVRIGNFEKRADAVAAVNEYAAELRSNHVIVRN